MSRPALSPYKVENLICYGCSSDMRFRIEKMANGKPVSITYYCDTCQYAFQKTLEHAMGDLQTPKYSPPEDPQAATKPHKLSKEIMAKAKG